MEPLVSIVITTYNRPVEVKRAIKSAIAQTYDNREILVIEDGTECGVASWIQENGYTNIIYYKNPQNVGLAASRNKGIEIAKGEFVTFLDDDDVLRPDYLQKKMSHYMQLSYAEQKATGLILSGVEVRDPEDMVIGKYNKDINGSLKELIRNGFIKTISSSLLIKKEALQKLAFDEKLKSSIDHDMFMSLASLDQHVITVTDPLVINYEYPNKASMMKDPSNRINGIKQFLEKWRPFLLKELGEPAGLAFIENYFSRVVAYFAVSQLDANKFQNWLKCLREIKAYNSKASYQSYSTFFKLSAKSLTKRIIPAKILHRRKIKQLSTA